MTIRLMNTKTRKVEEFLPLDPANVRMYVCGPTVYDRAHLGNARPVVVFDVLYRLLRHVYGESHVTYVRNFTDVDDKINAAALARQQAGDRRSLEELIRERTEETIRWYHADMDALGALRPDQEPRATEYIEEMKEMIATLIERGFAYVVRDPSNDPPAEFVLMDRERAVEEHALFEVSKYSDYGQLSGRSVEDMIAGARVEVAPYKRNPADFVLWKPSDAETPGWESPWGRGRPGWHIECSAMSLALLGEQFDVHGGGIDLQFPHHENEIAQSCCALATPDDPLGHEKFARYWLHNEMLQVEGKKMSKSLGNFFTVRDLLDQGVPGEVIRFVMLGTHYRKPMDWTEKKRGEAEAVLTKWRKLVQGIEPIEMPFLEVVEALYSDLNTPLAIARLHERIKESTSVSDLGRLVPTLRLLGLGDGWTESWANWAANGTWRDEIRTVQPSQEAIQRVIEIVREIDEARLRKDYRRSDELRTALEEAGVKVRNTSVGSDFEMLRELDIASLEAIR